MRLDLDILLLNLKEAARLARQLPTSQKNQLLLALASNLEAESASLLEANRSDLEALKDDATAAFRDRLTLNPARLRQMAESLRQVASLPDPVGEIVESRTLANGLQLEKIRAPLGVLFMIFESRPNVILEAFSLAFKAGNVILLRGGSESRHTARAIYALMEKALSSLKYQPFFGLQDYNRELVNQLLKRKDRIDVVIPRGGDQLIELVQKTALMPIIKNDRGMCHAYVDETADLEMALRIVENGKVQRPGVCNSLETVLVHQKIAAQFLPKLLVRTRNVALQFRADERSRGWLGADPSVQPAESADWDTEYLDLILNCRVVDHLDDALEHIQEHGSKHSEVIITANAEHAKKFLSEVDAAAVYWNASTRFTDGFEFGLGGELGISTQKLHVRGPVGLRELTTPRWIAVGNGQIR